MARLRRVGLAFATVVVALGGCTSPERPLVPVEPLEVIEASIAELGEAMAAGRVTSEELVERYLARIGAYDQQGPALNTIIALNPDASDVARALDEERAAGNVRGPLHGVPIVIKDNYDLAGMPTTNGSVALAELVPPDDGFQVRRLKEAGAVILGKTNLHEFARGITTVSSRAGQTRNPYGTERNPGGSSGGTGAAVAASFAAVGMGSDTCGSIRIPSAHNNLTGLRGTQGLSSRDGVFPLSHTQDIAGPMARSVTDLALVLDATVGSDPDDPATADADANIPVSYVTGLDAGALASARVGVLRGYVRQGPEDDAVGAVFDGAMEDLARLGAEVEMVAVDGLAQLLDSYVVLSSEFKFSVEGYLAAVEDAPVSTLDAIIADGRYDASIDERLNTSNAVTTLDTAEYREAFARRAETSDRIIEVMDERNLDALLYPTMRQVAAEIGRPQGGDNCRISANTGLPALTVQAGFTDEGMPVGLEWLGRPWSESRLLALGYAYEQGTRHRRAPASTPALGGRAQ